MFDVSFYKMLSSAQDELYNQKSYLDCLKQRLEEIGEEIGGYTQDPPEDLMKEYSELRDKVGETYLATQYAAEIFNELSDRLSDVKLLSSFVGERISHADFNRLYETRFED